MGSYKEIEGDLLELFEKGELDVIAHGCNCRTLMGAGIALQIKKKYPAVFEADGRYALKDMDRLGNYSYMYVRREEAGFGLIFNLYTQYNPGKNLDYAALKLALQKLGNIYKGSDSKIGLPLIGCGIAGGNWETVQNMIKTLLADCNVIIVKYKK